MTDYQSKITEQIATGVSVPSLSQINEQTNAQLIWIRLELPEVMNEQEKKVHDIVWNKTLLDARENGEYKKGITIKFIENGIFLVKNIATTNGTIYVNENGEILFGMRSVKERAFIKPVFSDLKIVEIKDSKWILNLYRTNEKGKPIWKQLDINSQEYFHLWKDQIIFRADVYDILAMLKFNIDDDEEWMRLFAKHGILKFEILEEFKKRNMIDEKTFQYGLSEMQKIIVSQCWDGRFEELAGKLPPDISEVAKLFRPIMESDLKYYIEKKYISPDLAKQCFQMLPKERRDVSEARK